MRGVTFDISVPRFVAGRALGGLTESVLFGRASGLSLRERPQLPLPGPAWVRAEVVACGICGSDVSALSFHQSPLLEPFASFPAVLGHEVLARVTATGAGVSRVAAGQRVAVDPVVSCRVRGLADDPCPSCRAGRPTTCARSGESGPVLVGGAPLAPGFVGYNRTLPGGWGDEMVLHESQVHPVDDALGDDRAVLIEPFAVAVHAVLGARPRSDARVLVIGSGPIALATTWALRALGHEGPLVAQAKRSSEQELARALGASDTVAPGGEAERALLATGARAYQPIIGPAVHAGGGFDTVFDCVGSAATLTQALAFAAAHGTVVVLGCAALVRKLDLSLLWSRELVVRGFVAYGRERHEDAELHTFELTQKLLAASTAPVERLVTSRFPLARYRDALHAARDRRRTGDIKVLLER